LIKGASQGVGLGIQFLRHVERTKVILHLISMDPNNGRDAYEDYLTIRQELAGYTNDLTKKTEIVVASQMDIPGSEEKLQELKKKLNDKIIYPISSITHKGVRDLMIKAADIVYAANDQVETAPVVADKGEQEYVYKKLDDSFVVEKVDEHYFVISGDKLERLVQRINLDHTDGVMMLARKLKRMGIDDALREKGAQNGDEVTIGNFTFEFVE
ncbi:MAG: Obg family GTPase CgtA, partial [Lactobacillus iners]|nr:Obg family GTPase CgtA [Lactobacillus iners]